MTDPGEPIPYEYIEETQTDEELRCPICHRPFEAPVSLNFCQHTLCEKCINKWLERKNTCPICTRKISNNLLQCPYSELNTPIVLNQLNRLPVRCLLCGQKNIQRGNFSEHEKLCTEKIIPCPAADIRCPWKGKRDELAAHLQTCTFIQIKPVVDDLKDEHESATRRLESLIQALEYKVNFLFKLVNKGNVMVQECTRPMHECEYHNRYSMNANRQHKCTNCNEMVPLEHISIHCCSGGCICQECLEFEYPDDNEDDDTHQS